MNFYWKDSKYPINLTLLILVCLLIATILLGVKTYQNALKDEKNYENESYDARLLFKIRGVGLIFIGALGLFILFVKMSLND